MVEFAKALGFRLDKTTITTVIEKSGRMDPRASRQVKNFNYEAHKMSGYIRAGLFSTGQIDRAYDNFLGALTGMSFDSALDPANDIDMKEIIRLNSLRIDIGYLEKLCDKMSRAMLTLEFNRTDILQYKNFLSRSGYAERFRTDVPGDIALELKKVFMADTVKMMPNFSWAIRAIAGVPKDMTPEQQEKFAERERGIRDAAVSIVAGGKPIDSEDKQPR